MINPRYLPYGVAPARFAAAFPFDRKRGWPGEPEFPTAAPGACDPVRVTEMLAPDRVSLERLMTEARALTDRHFGRRVILYAPCYLSSHCVGQCLYCGFRYGAPGPRRILDVAEAVTELRCLASRGITRVVLVAGDYPSRVTPGYLEAVLEAASSIVPECDLETAPAPVRHYRRYAERGAGGVVCYQEVYDRGVYEPLHPRGTKTSWDYRLGTLERAAAAGMRRLGAGILLGLSPDPRGEVITLIAHARFLQALHPDAQIGVSLPRLRPAVAGFRPAARIEDEDLIRFYAVIRLALPRAHLVLSTREPPELRRRLLGAGITQMSAGSVTAPGGYAAGGSDLDQFEISDRRGVAEVAEDLVRLGYEPRWNPARG